jgi:hypothetical protein
MCALVPDESITASELHYKATGAHDSFQAAASSFITTPSLPLISERETLSEYTVLMMYDLGVEVKA